MSTAVTICQATFGLNQGYILPHYFKALSIRSRPSFIIHPTYLYSENTTPDQKFLHKAYIYGDEIDLKWDTQIPESKRVVCLSFDLKELKKNISRILKKDQASLFIVQNRTADNLDKFDEEGSSDDFTIFVSRGSNDREGLQSIPAIRFRPQTIAVIEPPKSVRMKIPVKVFRDMMNSFSKCRQDDQVKITFYDAQDNVEPGILLSSSSILNNGNVVEKCGNIPEQSPIQPIAAIVASQAIDEKAVVVRPQASKGLQIVVVDQASVSLQPNEFMIDVDKASYFSNFAGMYNEGTVRIYYAPNCDLRFAFRFGPYGEQNIYINNSFRPS